MAPRVDLYTKYVDLGPTFKVPDPEKGPLERRVSVQFLDALFSDEINEEDAAYWFTCPPGGWEEQERKVLLKAKRVDVPRSQQGLRPADEPSAATRTPLLSLRVGEILDGTVCGMALSTGIHVDVGARYNGILPVKSDFRSWNKKLKGKLRMGDKCRVRVAKIIYSPLCRFPLVLEIVDEPDILDAFVPTDEYTGAFDLRGAPDSNSSLSGNDLAVVMDSLTDGAWSGGTGYEAAAVPIPTGGEQAGDMVDAERLELGAEVDAWLKKAGEEAKARARQQRRGAVGGAPYAASSSSSSSSDFEDDDEERAAGEGAASARAELRSGDASGVSDDDDDFDENDRGGSKSNRDGSDDDGFFSGMVLEEVDHTDLDAAIAGLW